MNDGDVTLFRFNVMEDVMFVLELIGAAAFAVSGAMVAIEKKADIFEFCSSR